MSIKTPANYYVDINEVVPVCEVLCLVAQSCPILCDPMDCSPPGSSLHGDSPGKNTGVGCHALLQGIFKPRSPTSQADSLPSNHEGSPRISEWVAYPFSRGSFQLRNWTRVFCIAGRLFTSWATREAHTWVQMKTKSCWEHWVCCYHQLLILSLLLKHKHFHLCHYEIWIKESVCVFSDYFTCDWV